jgi:hypothetical protein
MKRHPLVSMAAAGLLLAACGSAPSSDTGAPASTGPAAPTIAPEGPASSAPETTARAGTTMPGVHQQEIVEGEQASLTAMLAEVPGYHYVDIDPGELDAQLAAVPRDVFSAVSFHDVVRNDDESAVAFLTLFEFGPSNPVPHASDETMTLAKAFMSPDAGAATEVTIGDQTIARFEDPSSPRSRYYYLWLRHGVFAAADGTELVVVTSALTNGPVYLWSDGVVVGLFVAKDATAAEDFLARYLEAVSG